MSKETKKFNDQEIYVVTKMLQLELWRKYANELLLELIRDGKVDRTDAEVTEMCANLAEALHESEEAEENRRQGTH